jgi:hypothetical protein
VLPLELAISDAIALLFQFRHDHAAAQLDGQHRVLGSMRDEDWRFAGARAAHDEPRLEPEYGREHVSIGEPDRKRVRGSIRKSSHCDPRRIDSSQLYRLRK